MGNFGGPSGIPSTRGPPAAPSLGFALNICRPAGLKWVALDGVTEKSCDITERQNRESFPLAIPSWPPGLKSAYSSAQPPRRRAAEIPLIPDPSQACAARLTQPLGSGISKAAMDSTWGVASEGSSVVSAAPSGLGKPGCYAAGEQPFPQRCPAAARRQEGAQAHC
ncbi:uncharacterized protein LOC112630124 [Theropithecus gelada]|uniref:uncharacterized protein LOC112630124 n=1 Tax=Theropithecus gelada TaxID=9565 RepID=UPI000DC18C80|nr:uncharacterized protein LOC112630124 [Theropithecus gelada]